MNWLDEEDRRILEQIRAEQRRVEYVYAGVLISALVLVIVVAVLVLG